MPFSPCPTLAPLIPILTTAQDRFSRAYTQLQAKPHDLELLNRAKEARQTLETQLQVCERELRKRILGEQWEKMQDILTGRSANFAPNTPMLLIPPEIPDVAPEITPESIRMVCEILGGKEAWQLAIRPTAADFKTMCQWTDPATGETYDWDFDSPYGEMFFPKADINGFDQAQGLKSTPRPSWLTRMADGGYGGYTNLAVTLRSIHHELLEDEQRHPQALILIDTAVKPAFCGDSTFSDDKLAIDQAYEHDTLLKALKKLVAPTNPDLAIFPKHRFKSSYTDWTETILPKINRILAKHFADFPYTVTLTLASFYDVQQEYLRHPASTQTNCSEWTRTRLINDAGQVPVVGARALLSGDSAHGGLSCASGRHVGISDVIGGCRFSLRLEPKR